jgi:RNA polymerase sigma factor (sigma-70 family)
VEKFDQIYKQYYPLIYRLVVAIIQRYEDVPDIVQNVFVKLYLQMEQGVVVEFPGTWLSKVATNESRNFITRRRSYASLDTVRNMECDEADLTENRLIQAESQANLQNALDRLGEKEKLLLRLYAESFSYKEMAEIAGIQVSSVGKSIFRALEKLRNTLNR